MGWLCFLVDEIFLNLLQVVVILYWISRGLGELRANMATENGRVHPNCANASNPYHECGMACLEKIAQGQGQKEPKKKFGNSLTLCYVFTYWSWICMLNLLLNIIQVIFLVFMVDQLSLSSLDLLWFYFFRDEKLYFDNTNSLRK